MTHRYHPEAAKELLASVEFYESRQLGVGGEFLDEVDRAIATIKEAPMRWSLIEQDVRRYPLNRFPFNLLYRVREELVIVAVAHQHRKPGYWMDRID